MLAQQVGQTLKRELQLILRNGLAAKMKDGRTHLAYKAEHAVDLEAEAIVAAEVKHADRADTGTVEETVEAAEDNLAASGSAKPVEDVVGDKGYHDNRVLTARRLPRAVQGLVVATAPMLSSPRLMKLVVVDTSVFVAALRSADGASRQVLRLAVEGAIEPVMGQKLFLEFLDLFERPGFFDDCPVTAEDRLALFEGFLSACRWCEVFFLWRPNLPDEGDNHVVELAVAAGAGTVVTHNVVDFRGELRFPRVEVLRPKEFLKLKR